VPLREGADFTLYRGRQHGNPIIDFGSGTRHRTTVVLALRQQAVDEIRAILEQGRKFEQEVMDSLKSPREQPKDFLKLNVSLGVELLSAIVQDRQSMPPVIRES
jgi:hypothetical protein